MTTFTRTPFFIEMVCKLFQFKKIIFGKPRLRFLWSRTFSESCGQPKKVIFWVKVPWYFASVWDFSAVYLHLQCCQRGFNSKLFFQLLGMQFMLDTCRGQDLSIITNVADLKLSSSRRNISLSLLRLFFASESVRFVAKRRSSKRHLFFDAYTHRNLFWKQNLFAPFVFSQRCQTQIFALSICQISVHFHT